MTWITFNVPDIQYHVCSPKTSFFIGVSIGIIYEECFTFRRFVVSVVGLISVSIMILMGKFIIFIYSEKCKARREKEIIQSLRHDDCEVDSSENNNRFIRRTTTLCAYNTRINFGDPYPLPADFGIMDHLEDLFLIDFKLPETTKNLTRLKTLEIVGFDHDKLLPSLSSLSCLVNLTWLITDIQVLPRYFATLPNLRILTIDESGVDFDQMMEVESELELTKALIQDLTKVKCQFSHSLKQIQMEDRLPDEYDFAILLNDVVPRFNQLNSLHMRVDRIRFDRNFFNSCEETSNAAIDGMPCRIFVPGKTRTLTIEWGAYSFRCMRKLSGSEEAYHQNLAAMLKHYPEVSLYFQIRWMKSIERRSPEVSHFITINQSGRALLASTTADKLPPSIWPKVFGRINKKGYHGWIGKEKVRGRNRENLEKIAFQADGIYYLLRHGPLHQHIATVNNFHITG